MKICLFETYYGGSHKSFADGYLKNSRHNVELYTLPERNYKWRIRGSALHLLENGYDLDKDLLFVSDMFNVADYKALRGINAKPVVTYFHENQITYPHKNSVTDFGLGMINIVSALASDRLIFNSKTHFKQFLDAIPLFLKRAPDYRPEKILEKIVEKSCVLYPGCSFEIERSSAQSNKKPLIIWNHRWDYDKKPENFFHLLRELKKQRIEFNVALLGQNYDRKPEVFVKAEEEFKENILFSGFAESRAEYFKWLKKGDIVLSCAIQENFGYSVVEAVYYGCFPILPERLSYPEIIPDKFHGDVLYRNPDEMIKMTIDTINDLKNRESMVIEMSEHMGKYSWDNIINDYDLEMERAFDGA